MAGSDSDNVFVVGELHDEVATDIKFAIVGTSMVKYQHHHLPAQFSVMSFPGKTIDYISERVSKMVISADVLYFHAGSNDLSNGESISRSLERVSEFISQLHDTNPQLRIVISAILPRRESRLDGPTFGLPTWEYNRRCRVFNEEMMSMSWKFPFVSILEHPEFRWRWLSGDGVHPTRKGNVELADSFIQHSKEMSRTTLSVPPVTDSASTSFLSVDDAILPPVQFDDAFTCKPRYADILRTGLMRRPKLSPVPCPPESSNDQQTSAVHVKSRRSFRRQSRRHRHRRRFNQRSVGRSGFIKPKSWVPQEAGEAYAAYCSLKVGEFVAKVHPKFFIYRQKAQCSDKVKKPMPAKLRKKKPNLQASQVVTCTTDCPFCTKMLNTDDDLLDHILTECPRLEGEQGTYVAEMTSHPHIHHSKMLDCTNVHVV